MKEDNLATISVTISEAAFPVSSQTFSPFLLHVKGSPRGRPEERPAAIYDYQRIQHSDFLVSSCVRKHVRRFGGKLGATTGPLPPPSHRPSVPRGWRWVSALRDLFDALAAGTKTAPQCSRVLPSAPGSVLPSVPGCSPCFFLFPLFPLFFSRATIHRAVPRLGERSSNIS